MFYFKLGINTDWMITISREAGTEELLNYKFY